MEDHEITSAGRIASEAVVNEGAAIAGGVPGDYLLEGFRRARQRFAEASSTRRINDVETFIPLFEALNFAAAIEVKLRWDARREGREAYDNKTPDGQLLLALRFVRGRMHHQWALAHDPRDVAVPKIQVQLATPLGHSGVRPPASVLDWHWLPPERLLPPDEGYDDEKLEEAYRDRLQDKPVRITLEEIGPVLERLCEPGASQS